jgi:RNA polymerase sigma factor (sigma-70 family)
LWLFCSVPERRGRMIATMGDDVELLRQYVEVRSNAAFTELVERYIGFVYSTALRRAHGRDALAKDITQDVFVALAKKSETLLDRRSLTGWLYIAAQNAAAGRIRDEIRRQQREHEAYAAELTEDQALPWDKLRPVIDDTLAELDETDRDAVLMRFFEGRSYADIGDKLILTEDAARMRLNRALDKLSALLAKRGLTSTGAALGYALAAQAAGAVSPVVVRAVIDSTLQAAAPAPAAWLALLTMNKVNIGIATALMATSAISLVHEVRANRELQSEISALETKQSALAKPASIAGDVAASVDAESSSAELLRLKQRAAILRSRPKWVIEVDQKPVTGARNAGWASAEAALETFMWATSTGDSQALIDNFHWFGDAKVQADAAFAQLNEVIRSKYGSADRLAASVAFVGLGGAAVDYQLLHGGGFAMKAGDSADPIAAYWPSIDPDAQYSRPGLLWRTRNWVKLQSGAERAMTLDLAFTGDRWTFGTNLFSADAWQKIVAAIDPQTGDLKAISTVARQR